MGLAGSSKKKMKSTRWEEGVAGRRKCVGEPSWVLSHGDNEIDGKGEV